MANILSFDLTMFLVGILAAAFVTGLAGFAFGMVAAAVWLYALTPPQTSALTAGASFQAWLNDRGLIDHRNGRFAAGRIRLWTALTVLPLDPG